MPDKPNVLLIGCGSFPTGELTKAAEEFIRQGWQVQVVLTPTGRKFAEAAGVVKDLERLTGSQVLSDYAFPLPPGAANPARPDIDIRKVSAVLVAPATVDFISAVHAGTQPDLALGVTIEAMGAEMPVVFVPYTNAVHWNSPPIRRNVEEMKGWKGVEFVELALHQPRSTERLVIPWEQVVQYTVGLAHVRTAEQPGLTG